VYSFWDLYQLHCFSIQIKISFLKSLQLKFIIGIEYDRIKPDYLVYYLRIKKIMAKELELLEKISKKLKEIKSLKNLNNKDFRFKTWHVSTVNLLKMLPPDFSAGINNFKKLTFTDTKYHRGDRPFVPSASTKYLEDLDHAANILKKIILVKKESGIKKETINKSKQKKISPDKKTSHPKKSSTTLKQEKTAKAKTKEKISSSKKSSRQKTKNN